MEILKNSRLEIDWLTMGENHHPARLTLCIAADGVDVSLNYQDVVREIATKKNGNSAGVLRIRTKAMSANAQRQAELIKERACHCASHVCKGFRDQWIAQGKWKPEYERAWQATHPGEADWYI